MTSTPIWYLDVDGVINAFPPPKPHKAYAKEFEHIDVLASDLDGHQRAFPIWYRPAVIDAINEIHRSRRARMCWLTTWGSEANTRLAPALGLDEFDVVDGYDGTSPLSDDWWKLRVIEAQVRPGERFVFTDDSLSYLSRRRLRAAYGKSALLITPRSVPGLTDEHLEQIDAFLV